MFKLTKLRKEMQITKEMGGIINVLQGVASSEFYRLQKARKQFDEFGNYLKAFFGMVNIGGFRHPFLEASTLAPGVLSITSDTGFLGKLNISVVNTSLEQCAEKGKMIIVGRQGVRLTEEAGVKSLRSFPGISDEVNYEEVEELGNFIVDSFLGKKIGNAAIVYPHFVSFSIQDVRVYQMLPCRFLFREETVSTEVIGESGVRRGSERDEDIIVEPSLSKIVEYLVRMWVNYILYGIFWESKLSEWAARVIHLEGSSFEIKQISKRLRFQYFRLLHEISDKNIREIFSARLAMKERR